MADSMTCVRTDDGDQTELRIEGQLVESTVDELRPVVDALVDDNRRDVLLELSKLDLVDQEAVHLIVSLTKRLRAIGGKVRLVGLKNQPRSIFLLLRLDRLFPGQL